MLTNILTVLAAPGWNITRSDDFVIASLQNIVDHFAEPLTKVGIGLTALEQEWLDMVYYAKTSGSKMKAILFGVN